MTEPNRLSSRKDNAPLSVLNKSEYGFTQFVYPSDIETLSHAMLFNINVQGASQDITSGRERFVTLNVAGATPEELATTQVGSRASIATQGNLLGLTRKTRRVERAIALYVPDTVVFDNKQEYQSPNLLDKLGIGGTLTATGISAYQSYPTTGAGIAGAVFGAATGQVLGEQLFGALGGLSTNATRALNRFGIVGQALGGIARAAQTATDINRLRLGAQVAGFAINPVIEVLYSAPSLRSFNFDFVFAPRDEFEADLIWKIIYEFRRHSSPELVAAGTIFIPPSEFDITFLRKSSSGFVENTNIPRITTCVLEDVQVDYASSGFFATHHDGMPVQIRMRLQFKEINMITRELIDQGY